MKYYLYLCIKIFEMLKSTVVHRIYLITYS